MVQICKVIKRLCFSPDSVLNFQRYTEYIRSDEMPHQCSLTVVLEFIFDWKSCFSHQETKSFLTLLLLVGFDFNEFGSEICLECVIPKPWEKGEHFTLLVLQGFQYGVAPNTTIDSLDWWLALWYWQKQYDSSGGSLSTLQFYIWESQLFFFFVKVCLWNHY